MVRGVISGTMVAGSMFNVSSTSHSTATAPLRRIALPVPNQESGVVMTSSPGPIPNAFTPRMRASVPEPTPIPWRRLQNDAICRSNSATSGPITIRP